MKILVTGATGFIGRHLVPALKARGHEVVAYSRKGVLQVPKVDGIIHLAGENIAQRWTAAAKKRIFESRVGGTRRLIDQTKPSFFISASATGYYGPRGDEVLTESSGAGKGFLSSVCVAWEGALLERADLKARKAVLRLAPVIGSGGGMLRKMMGPFRLGLGGKFGNGKQWMSWVHIHDVVGMFLKLAEDSSLDGVFNGVAPEPCTNERFTKALASALKRPAFFSVPRLVLKLALGEMASALLDSQRVVPKRFLDLGFPFRFRSIEPALLFSTSEDQEQ